ncbi:sigma-70 family RNA polymerase sigma factor [Clostridium uliginosum]|uniref:RNA polymerase sigma-70 factor, ECF subfamily n=1 Tax=Clostridium uliginosum TaxID=119641 RepID=A0A1I1PLA3_9CLOT|nr:sigma-70 family RNA polymerase sigma factor [Clostridium uliginosum]SFD10526.1 RNA polymerase sigma-70 factor, ECF subfamily [Clostridium uliginosum]
MLKNFKRKKVEKYIIDNRNLFYRIAYTYTKNEANALDVVQESIYKALSSVESLREYKYVKSWFYRILIRTSIDYIRKNTKYSKMMDISEVNDTGKYDQYTDIDLEEALNTLSADYKTIIILRFFEDLKIEEIAEILNENTNTIKTRLYTALRKLKIKIER